ncbi:hypothetical protein P280DRAFT_229681 [Massarina eburnea CBS 473.64]|uniref:Uncharacterized protein n=1 Tax=Massarina eburnea CBS 473.64 TaxID=1395130 RepID=A0A6A6SD36_9PLEO|nr:hypothetical protein P280DRAFT_229681 [Massarina eburnea CBS 473.64]
MCQEENHIARLRFVRDSKLGWSLIKTLEHQHLGANIPIDIVAGVIYLADFRNPGSRKKDTEHCQPTPQRQTREPFASYHVRGASYSPNLLQYLHADLLPVESSTCYKIFCMIEKDYARFDSSRPRQAVVRWVYDITFPGMLDSERRIMSCFSKQRAWHVADRTTPSREFGMLPIGLLQVESSSC